MRERSTPAAAQHRYWLELLLGDPEAASTGRFLQRHCPRRYAWFEASDWRRKLWAQWRR